MSIMSILVASGAKKAIISYNFTQTISVNTVNYNLRAAAVAAGWNQVLPLNATVTINAGVYLYSTSTGAYAFRTGTTFPAETSLKLINNGTILGMGGAGSTAAPQNTVSAPVPAPGSAGGPALLAEYALTITNNSIIGGGGGGAGAGSADR